MRAALSTLAQASLQKGGRRIAVLGDMGELGKNSETMHAELAEVVKELGINRVYTVGPHMKNLSDGLEKFLVGGHFDNHQALESQLLKNLRPGDVVMVKGSNASGMKKVVKRILEMVTPDIQEAV